MNHSLFTNNFSINKLANLYTCGKRLPRIILLALLGSFFLLAPAQASESRIDIVDSWVEDGFLFHVAFEAEPANTNCELEGEGLIEFEVAYDSQTSSEAESVFGVATWYPGSDADTWTETEGQAIGPQALCTRFSPCRIQQINIVKAWCPVTDGPLFYR